LDVMKEDRRKQSERFSEQESRNYVIMITELILTLCSFFQENKSYGVKKPFALILCLPATIHHIANINYMLFKNQHENYNSPS
jgi:hypothetical protein